ncbi:S1/P1 nuclease [Psychrosphaera haliotis]|uniref:S1/P1 nuclease n=1 Tax=Psychrosphaera haliotis TaxID=555083 RepID=UPI00236D63E4|nr:S1/P1 nuclease [Psychrosphaera haliotis]
MKNFKLVLLTTLASIMLLAVSNNAAAYGQNGHRIIGQIAEWHLTPVTKQAIEKLLSGDHLPEVTTWADEMRSSPDKKWWSRTKWHYISLNTIDDFKPDTYKFEDEVKDVYTGIRKAIDVLSSPKSKQQEKEFYLRFLTHLVGDLHMPLHVGRAEDKGGNTIQVEFFREKMNLHTLWDTKLIESQNLSFTEFARFINTTDTKLVSNYVSTQPRDWVVESFNLRDDVYDIKDGEFSYDYIYRHMPTVKDQLRKGGIRLAGILNAIFDPNVKVGKNGVKIK